MEQLSFEELIIHCCIADEVELRNQIKEVLSNHNFSFIEDDYVSYRNNYENVNIKVHNLLFTRGNAKYCLVAHTDVCRDHAVIQWEKEKKLPTPVFKELNGERIIQDKDCETQIGGDDRLGVAMALWLAMHTQHELAILLTTDEEVGLRSAMECKFEQLNQFELLIQIDRGNETNQIVNKIKDIELCDQSTLDFISQLLQSKNINRKFVTGLSTDVFALKKNNMCKNAINMTCGYHDSMYDSGEEYIHIQEAKDTLSLLTFFLEAQIR